MISRGWPLRGNRTTQSTLLEGLLGWPARSRGAKKNAAAASPEASEYGTLKPGLESDQAAAVQRGGGPVCTVAGTHAASAVVMPRAMTVACEPPHATSNSVVAPAAAKLPRTERVIDSHTPWTPAWFPRGNPSTACGVAGQVVAVR